MQKSVESILRTCAAFACTALLSISLAIADTSVWSVRSGDNVIYLGGTVHLLRPSDYPLPEEFEEAYQGSSELYFETDIASMSDLSMQTQMLQQLTYSDDRLLRTVLSNEACTVLSAYTQTAGLPIAMLGKFKPELLISTLQILVFQSMGFTPQGVDAFFHARALRDGKAEGQLETVQEQIGFIAAMGEGNESEFILLSLEDLVETGDVIDVMIGAWRSGDAGGLSELFVEDMKVETPALYDSLLLQRNLKWVPQIDRMLQDADTEFVLVGVAHIVGENGLLDLLSQKDYEINQL
jgi:uncharacterized protein YbaP (TraB family)